MAHYFSLQFSLTGASLQNLRHFIANPDVHEAIARKIPGSNLNILQSGISGRRYAMQREYNLEVNIHELAKKFLKDAFRLKREDVWDLDNLSCRSRFTMNLPAELSCTTRVAEQDGQLVVRTDWEVNVRIPLIHQIIAKHAEGEITRFNEAEIVVIQNEINSRVVV